MTNTDAVTPLYSPLPPEAYSRPCGTARAGVGYELRALNVRPLWNLYWLSEPKLDEFLQGGPRSLIDLRVVRACRVALDQTLSDRPVLAWMQGEHPMLFAGALLQHRHKHLEPYKLLGRQWVERVLGRASTCRGLMVEHASVKYVNFCGRPTDVTLAGNSAKIMPLAYPKI